MVGDSAMSASSYFMDRPIQDFSSVRLRDVQWLVMGARGTALVDVRSIGLLGMP